MNCHSDEMTLAERYEAAYAVAWRRLRMKESAKSVSMPVMRGGSAEKQKLKREAREEAIVPHLIENIQRYPQMTQEVRARMLNVSRHSVARVIARLKDEGVLRMAKSPEGRHIWIVTDTVGAE